MLERETVALHGERTFRSRASNPAAGYTILVQTIVIGYDGTEHADQALERAGELSQALSAELVVVSVGRSGAVEAPEPILAPTVPTAAGPGVLVTRHTGPEPVLAPHEPDDAQLLLERARRFLGTRRIDADFVAELGDPVERLLAVADERGADMIVVGAHERHFLQLLLGPGSTSSSPAAHAATSSSSTEAGASRVKGDG
jgi:nucleotide-binding universal stress UspA family protein